MARFNYHGLAKRADKIMRQFGAKSNHAFFSRGGVRRAVVALEADFGPREPPPMFDRPVVRFLVSCHEETTPPDKEQDTFIWTNPDTMAETEYIIAADPKRTGPGGENVFWQLFCEGK